MSYLQRNLLLPTHFGDKLTIVKIYVLLSWILAYFWGLSTNFEEPTDSHAKMAWKTLIVELFQICAPLAQRWIQIFTELVFYHHRSRNWVTENFQGQCTTVRCPNGISRNTNATLNKCRYTVFFKTEVWLKLTRAPL